MEIIISFIAGMVFTAAVAFFIAKYIVDIRLRQSQESVKMQTEAFYKVELAKLESELSNSRVKVAELEAALEKEKTDAAKMLDNAKSDLKAGYENDLKRSDESHKESMKALQAKFDETIAKISERMKLETGEMLKARQKEFSESSNNSIGQIVNPLKENIENLKKVMEAGSKEQAERNGEMRERIRSLIEHSEAAKNKIQGDWGETILEELLAAQGLTKGIHFDTQAVIVDSDGHPVRGDSGGIMRPDIILHLDERREVIIDSKVSMASYVDYVNAETETDRQLYLKAHIESIKRHIKELAAKDYAGYVKSPKVSAGYVIMFVPNVGALWIALNAEPDLWRKAAEQNVYIADEQSLYGALKIVRLTWTQVAQAQNHEKVYELANEMIDRVGQFMDRYEAMGKALEKARLEYDNGMRKLTPQGQSIINTSGKLIRLGAKNSDKHPIRALSDIDDIPQLQE